MPTDLTKAIAWRRTRERRTLAAHWLVLSTLALGGSAVTILRAAHSEGFQAALALFATIG